MLIASVMIFLVSYIILMLFEVFISRR